jgi:hypothetical protein
MQRPRMRSLPLQRCVAQLLAFLMVLAPVFADPQAPPVPTQAPPAQAPANPPAPATSVAQPAAPQPAAPVAPAPPPTPLPVVQGLKVIPLAGKDEMNDLGRRLMAPLVVEVLDQNDRPLEGAEVVFRFPLSGPGAEFSAGKTSQTARTNGQGQVAALNWMANDQVGRFEVHVSASYGNQVGETTFSMSNVAKVDPKRAKGEKRGWFSPTWVKIAVIGGAAAIAVGVILATRGGGHSGSGNPTVTVTPGSPTVGGPQ